MATSTMCIGSVAVDEWIAGSLRPDQVVAGEPIARCHTFGISPDGLFSFNLWDCTAGRLCWTYRCDEIIHILEGGATLQPVGGVARTVGPGDVVYFPKGLVVHWEIASYIKKLAICRSYRDSLPRRLARKVRATLGV
jgi:hypothetical protein